MIQGVAPKKLDQTAAQSMVGMECSHVKKNLKHCLSGGALWLARGESLPVKLICAWLMRQ